MQSFLITGSDEKGRLAKFEEIAGKKISSLLNNPDFILLEVGEGSSIGIAEVKNLQDRLSFKPYREKEKIALIKEAQNLTTEAQNALLKTLEEPDKTTKIFLTTPDSTWLLPTVVSRCQIISLPSKPQIELTESEFKKILETFNEIWSSSPGRRIKIIEEQGIAKDRETAVKFLNKLTLIVRQLVLSSYDIADTPNPACPIKISISQYLCILNLINKYQKYLDANCNVKLTLDNFLLETSLSTPGVN